MNNRNRRVKIYLTEKEYEILYKKAKELDICVTNYIYRKATDKPLDYGCID
jgi:hypothetical protein